MPSILGVIDTSPRIYPGTAKIATGEQLRDLVMANQDSGIFGKIVNGMVSFSVFQIIEADATHITCAGHPRTSYDAFIADFIGDNSYALQKTIVNHPTIAPYASALATVRMINLVTDEGVFCPQAIIKLPQGNNIADAFWRNGNLACEVDVKSGVIRTIAERSKFEVTYHDDHPKIPDLMGLKLPHWDSLLEINARAAQIFAPIRYQSTDIAITETGPVLVELNYGGGFDLPQYASGRGLLTPEVRAFFESHGCSFAVPRTKKRRWFFGRR